MLKITLYKNCILNETYQNVISTAIKDGQSVLERYLATLSSMTIPDVEEVYYKNNGTLNFDLEYINSVDIYQFNYMKMEYLNEEDYLLLKRYCFIKDIQVNNDIVLLSYNEDVFSSYSNDIIKLTDSYLSKSRKLIYSNKSINLHTLPIEYNGNNDVDMSIEGNNQFSIIAKVQYYNAATFGNSSKRKYRVALLGKLTNTGAIPETNPQQYGFSIKYRLNLDEAIDFINQLYKDQSKKWYQSIDMDEIVYFRMEEIAIIPYDLTTYFNTTISSGTFTSEDYSQVKSAVNALLDELTFSPSINYAFTFHYIKNTYINSMIQIKSITKTNDFKRISIGTFNNQLKTINNGTSLSLKIRLWLDEANYYLYLTSLNQYIDITNDFIYKIPYTELNGETLELHRMQGTLQRMAAITGLNNVGTDSLITGLKTGTTTAKVAGPYAGAAAGIIAGGTNYVGGMITGIQKIQLAYSKTYTTSEGNFATSSGILNAKYGIVEFKINSDNDNFVLASVNNMGYNVYEYCNNLSMIDFENVNKFIIDNVNYDVIQFDKINIIGKFPRSIAQKLNEIFENGFKIWYNENLQDDNLGVR